MSLVGRNSQKVAWVGGQRPVDTESGTGETQRISCDPSRCRAHSLFLEIKEGKSGLSFDKLSKIRKYGRAGDEPSAQPVKLVFLEAMCAELVAFLKVKRR